MFISENFKGNGDTVRIGQEIYCLPYAGFFIELLECVRINVHISRYKSTKLALLKKMFPQTSKSMFFLVLETQMFWKPERKKKKEKKGNMKRVSIKSTQFLMFSLWRLPVSKGNIWSWYFLIKLNLYGPLYIKMWIKLPATLPPKKWFFEYFKHCYFYEIL